MDELTPQKECIKLMRCANGVYRWDINLLADVVSIKEVKRFENIDKLLQRKFNRNLPDNPNPKIEIKAIEKTK